MGGGKKQWPCRRSFIGTKNMKKKRGWDYEEGTIRWPGGWLKGIPMTLLSGTATVPRQGKMGLTRIEP